MKSKVISPMTMHDHKELIRLLIWYRRDTFPNGFFEPKYVQDTIKCVSRSYNALYKLEI